MGLTFDAVLWMCSSLLMESEVWLRQLDRSGLQTPAVLWFRPAGFCLCCGTQNVAIFHPLFKGSLCLKCKENFTETLYRYDEDGYQSYCTICCYGLEVVLCGNKSCSRSYCGDCVNILVGPGVFDSLKLLDPWICYMCQPQQAHGALHPRADWSVRVQTLFEPHRVYPCIPANLRRPLRVLSLFDGIATGESRFRPLDRWGPFDLLIGGSPCNDLSHRQPPQEGPVRYVRPPSDPRPFFWMFENVVFMNTHDRVNICRFLEVGPPRRLVVRSRSSRPPLFWRCEEQKSRKRRLDCWCFSPEASFSFSFSSEEGQDTSVS
uniref:PHD-type domain-containing protein n=1 Tax=Salarias fasciatus TaxID=181472 RepID=A0A672HRP8_SALFA